MRKQSLRSAGGSVRVSVQIGDRAKAFTLDRKRHQTVDVFVKEAALALGVDSAGLRLELHGGEVTDLWIVNEGDKLRMVKKEATALVIASKVAQLEIVREQEPEEEVLPDPEPIAPLPVVCAQLELERSIKELKGLKTSLEDGTRRAEDVVRDTHALCEELGLLLTMDFEGPEMQGNLIVGLSCNSELFGLHYCQFYIQTTLTEDVPEYVIDAYNQEHSHQIYPHLAHKH